MNPREYYEKVESYYIILVNRIPLPVEPFIHFAFAHDYLKELGFYRENNKYVKGGDVAFIDEVIDKHGVRLSFFKKHLKEAYHPYKNPIKTINGQ